MICLKNCTFVVSTTTVIGTKLSVCSLWFAWKIVPLWYQQQPLAVTVASSSCCDLLEKLYLCGINNNFTKINFFFELVVICLKNCTFVVSTTTRVPAIREGIGCDLLEKLYLCGINNNPLYPFYNIFALWFAWKIVPLWYQQQLT